MTLPDPWLALSGHAPRRPPSIGATVVVSVLLVGGVVALLWAVANPLPAAVVVTLAVGAGTVVGRARRRIETRRRADQSRQFCFDQVGVCIEV